MAGDRECTSNYMLTAKSKFQEGRCWYSWTGIGVGIAMVGVVAAMDSPDIEVAASPRMC